MNVKPFGQHVIYESMVTDGTTCWHLRLRTMGDDLEITGADISPDALPSDIPQENHINRTPIIGERIDILVFV